MSDSAADADPKTAPPELADPASESIGGVSLGDSPAQVEAAFGPPTTKSEVVEWAATGDRVSTWTWDGKGLILGMAEGSGGFTVLSMHIEAPCSATTSRGIGIGATFESVDTTYREFRGARGEDEEPEQWDDTQIIVGSIYGGTFFEFEAGQVVRIFVGAGAE